MLKITEEYVETVPQNIPSCVLDNEIDLNLIRDFFTEDGWIAVTVVFNLRKDLPWCCKKCNGDLTEIRSVGCDSCLGWFHYHCANIKTEPRVKYWYCLNCK